MRVGPGNRSELTIGVVRAIRTDGSDSIGVVRPIRSVFTDGGYGGYVTRTPSPPVQPGGLTVTRGRAASSGFTPADRAAAPSDAAARVLVPGIASSGPGSNSPRIYAGQPRPIVDGADPWDLLNAGRYLAAGEHFDAKGDDAQRTGAALAAALSGDLESAAALMPARPMLPEGSRLDDATVQRLRQVRAVFFKDDAVMRDALTSVLNAEN